MQPDIINVALTFFGILIWPEFTFAIILYLLGHPILAIIAFLSSYNSVKTLIKEKYIDMNGNIIKTKEYQE